MQNYEGKANCIIGNVKVADAGVEERLDCLPWRSYVFPR